MTNHRLLSLLRVLALLSLSASSCTNPAQLNSGQLGATQKEAAPKLTSKAISGNFDQLVKHFTIDYVALDLPNLDLSYTSNLEQLGSDVTLSHQLVVFQKYTDLLQAVDEASLGLCQLVELSIMRTETRLGQQRARLGLKHPYTNEIPATGLSSLVNGKEWYAYFLARWNGAWLDPDMLFSFGEKELLKAVAQYDAVQTELGYEHDDQGFEQHLAASPTLSDDQKISQWYQQQQDTVWENMAGLFTIDEGVTKAVIASSARGASFPAPGYYDLDSKTFYYNKMTDNYELRQSDWLLLHEATPGHHFQITNSRINPACAQRLPTISYSAYTEGWAAYVETMGSQLGLYQTAESRLAAIEWNMVRSARVALDVAINAYGWSDAKALDYWYKNVRGQRDIAQREITRMRQWPAQVVTYKYGANLFERLLAEHLTLVDSEAERVRMTRSYHDGVIGFRSMPLDTLELVLSKLLNPEKNK